MATYPKQLQFFEAGPVPGAAGDKIGSPAVGDIEIYSDGFTPGAPVTVNGMLAVLSDTIYGIDLTGITNNIRTRPRFQKFDTSFGDVVVFPVAPVSGPQYANEIIAIMRVLYDIDRTRDENQTGYATSVLN